MVGPTMDVGLHTGDIVARAEFPLRPEAKANSPCRRLKLEAVRLVTRMWPRIVNGTLERSALLGAGDNRSGQVPVGLSNCLDCD